MRWNRTIQTVDVHCAGEIGRVITGGVLNIPGATMADKLHHLNSGNDDLRRWLCSEPRSGPAGSFCLLVPACDPQADVGLIILQPDQAHAMSGSNAMCATTALLETGMIPMVEPVSVVTFAVASAYLAAQGVSAEPHAALWVAIMEAPGIVAGILLAGEGLHPTSRGARVRFDGRQRTVIDGPFGETKELVAGFWLWQVRTFDEAIEWIKRAPFDGGAEIELRPVFEADDFGDALTPELREQEARVEGHRDAFGRALVGQHLVHQPGREQHQLARLQPQLQVGAAFVNAIVKSDARLPFGGSKLSGLGREFGTEAVHAFTEPKSV